jgi:Xaa-Pro aminopeptidase
VFRHAFDRAGSCDTEADLKKVIDKKIVSEGVENAFPTIVASGPNIRHPHHIAGKQRLTGPLLMDLGVKVNGYCSDVTRTEGSRYQRIAAKALEAAQDAVKPGARASDIDKIARKALGRHQKHFITSLGHGVGLQIHEKPYISARNREVLKEGMIIAIEPGIYVPGGVRIENDILVTEDGCEVLTEFEL